MAIPDKRRTFDVNRNRTSLDHIISDYNHPSLDRDYQHYLEFASIYTNGKDNIEKEAQRLLSINYSIHYHVFEEEDVHKLIKWCNENTNIKLETIYVKHTSRNPGDNEFIFIIKVTK